MACTSNPTPDDSAPGAPEAISFLGEPLTPPEPSPEFRTEQEGYLEEARAKVEAAPGDLDAWIWWGRRTAYLGRYGEAIGIYTRAMERFPEEPRLYRHRGHRYLTIRKIEEAETDLERAAELMAGSPDRIEQDGLPNERNLPTSSLHTNVWYHLGLARYLAGDFEGARDAYRRCLEASRYDDMAVAARYWLALSQARSGDLEGLRENLTAVHPGLDVIESGDYLELLLHFRGEREGEELLSRARDGGGLSFATTAYGVGAWAAIQGDDERAGEIFREVVDRGPWAAFGAIAAEAELADERTRTKIGASGLATGDRGLETAR